MVTFGRTALGIECWPRQEELLRAVEKHARVAVRSGHKSGKSTSAVMLALWWAATKPRGRVVMTSPTNHQVRNILWKELKRIVYGARVPLPQPAQLPGIGMQWPDGREIIGFATKEAERIAGLSGPEMLFIVDEASGVEEDIFEALEGNRAGGAHILLTGNPTQPSGTFYEAFHSKAEFWHTLHISSEEAAAHRPSIAGLATDGWVNEKLAEWGEEDPRFQVRVRGNFADSAAYAVIPLGLLSRAQDEWADMDVPASRLELGVDVARFGDDETVIALRRGNKMLGLVAKTMLDEQAVADLVLHTAAEYHRKGEQKPLVKVDSCGVGLGVLSILRQASVVQVLGVRSADQSDVPDEYPNIRSQLWFSLADWIREGGTVLRDAKLEGDCLAPRYAFDARGRRMVEKKADMKRRLGRSPDRADALALAVYTPRVRLVRHLDPEKRAKLAASGAYRWGAGRGF